MMKWQIFFNNLFADVIELISQVRDYMQEQEPLDKALLECECAKKHISCETTKISVYMINIVSWMIARQAIFDGEISADNKFASYSDNALKLAIEFEDTPTIVPQHLRELSQKILNMHSRIKRLDKMTSPCH